MAKAKKVPVKKTTKKTVKKATKKPVVKAKRLKKFVTRITPDNEVQAERKPAVIHAAPPAKAKKPRRTVLEFEGERLELKPIPVKESVKPSLINTLDNISWLLENDSNAVSLVNRQELLHAIDPTLAKTTRFMPPGSTNADVWMVRYGDPLVSINAAFEMLRMVEPNPSRWKASWDNGLYGFKLFTGKRPIEGTAPTFPAAIVAVALYAQTAKDNVK